MAGGSKSEDKLARWQRIQYWDAVCIFYWASLFLSFCIIFNWPLDLRESFALSSVARKVLLLSGFWFGTVFLAQTIYGFWRMPKLGFRFLISPFSFVRVISGFIWDSRKVLLKIKKRAPLKSIFALVLFVTLLAGLSETNTQILALLMPFMWLNLAFVIYFCFSWTLNPIPFLEKMRTWASVGGVVVKNKAIANMVKIEVTNEGDAQKEILSRLSLFSSLVENVPKFLRWMAGPRILFAAFVGIFFFGAVSIVFLVAGILRIKHLLTPGGVFSGAFFQAPFFMAPGWITFMLR